MAESAPNTAKPTNKLRWLLGWIVLPGSLIAALFLTGVHVGARHPDMGLSRILLKVFHAKAGVADPSAPEQRKPREGAEPGEPFAYRETLSAAQLQQVADDNLGIDVAQLECEDVCRAYVKTQSDAPIYAIEHCTLPRAINSAPSLLDCRGKFEAKPIAPVAPKAKPEAKPEPAP